MTYSLSEVVIIGLCPGIWVFYPDFPYADGLHRFKTHCEKHCSRHLQYFLVSDELGRTVIYPKRYEQLLILDRPNLWLVLWECFPCPYLHYLQIVSDLQLS